MQGEDDPRSHAQEVSSPLHEAGTLLRVLEGPTK